MYCFDNGDIHLQLSIDSPLHTRLLFCQEIKQLKELSLLYAQRLLLSSWMCGGTWCHLLNEYVEPIFTQITNLKLQNQKLKAARDLLLPRLMSGEIAV